MRRRERRDCGYGYIGSGFIGSGLNFELRLRSGSREVSEVCESEVCESDNLDNREIALRSRAVERLSNGEDEEKHGKAVTRYPFLHLQISHVVNVRRLCAFGFIRLGFPLRQSRFCMEVFTSITEAKIIPSLFEFNL